MLIRAAAWMRLSLLLLLLPLLPELPLLPLKLLLTCGVLEHAANTTQSPAHQRRGFMR
jgi:hypothetical protein